MSAQTYVIYDKYNGHIVCDIKDNYRIFDNAVKAPPEELTAHISSAIFSI